MKGLGKIISLMMLPLIFIIIYGALRGYLFNAPPIWGYETTIFLYGSLFMLGSGYAHREKKHVAVDVLMHYVGPKISRILSIFAEMVVLFVALVIIYMSIPAAYRGTMIRERSQHLTPFNPQVWWYRWVIPISCALLSWQACRDILGLITGKGIVKNRRKKEEGEHNAA